MVRLLEVDALTDIFERTFPTNELLRRENPFEMGETPISIGLWLG